MKQLHIATESIAFQTGAFFKELSIIIQDGRDAGAASEDAVRKFSIRLDQCIHKHTGITTSTRFLEDYDNAFVFLPALTRGNVLHGRSFNEYLEKNFDADRLSFLDLEKKGWIDPANSRVGGAFSEIIFKTYLGFVFETKYTAEEIASIVLHEVGHAFTFLQFMADTIVVNTVLQRTYQELTNANADKKVKIILTKAADDMAIKNRDWLHAVDDATDGEVAYKLIASAVQIEDRVMDNKRFFSQDACEELAEIFAIRHGAGRALLTMRAKDKWDGTRPSRGYLVQVGFLIVSIMAAPLTQGQSIPLAILTAVILIATVSDHISSASSMPDITKFKQTATKIRNQFVEQIKTSKLPKEELVEILNSVNLADQLIQGYKSDYDPDMLAKFFDMFRKGKMDARASRDYTDVLERLASNDLFVRAAQLSSR